MTTSKYPKSNSRSKISNENIPLDIFDFSKCTLPDLQQLDNFLFVEHLGQRHIFPKRISSAKSSDVSTLKITYFTADHIFYLQQASNNIQRLDLSNSNLFKIPFNLIRNLNQLQVLILDRNQLNETSFCKEFGNILGVNLKELSLSDNLFSIVPNIFDNLNKLTRLKLDCNSLSTLRGLEKLKNLRLLNMEQNQLNQLGNGFYSLKRLEYSYLSNNKISSLSMSIKNMAYLREMDLSHNNLKSLPSEIFFLDNLEILKVNDNKISKIPIFKVTRKFRKSLLLVDLSSNNVFRFPDCVLKISEVLDLTNNKIRMISPQMINKIPYSTNQKLILKNNPLVSPPKEVCESGLKSMIQFYQESETLAKTYYGLKIFCVGSEKIDKLSIITSLIDPNEDDFGNQQKEIILDIFDASFEIINDDNQETKLLNVQFVDIIANNCDIEHWLMFFITCPALVLLFVDVDNYSKDSFMNSIGEWIRQVIIRQNEISFMLVGVTKIYSDKNQMATLNAIQSDVAEYFDNYTQNIAGEIVKIETQSKINPAMSSALKRLIQLKSLQTIFHEKCLLINSKRSKTTKALQQEIINIVDDSKIFKNVMSPIPSFWSDVQLFFEEESHNFPLITVHEYELLLQQKFNLKLVSLKIANFLHDNGYFLWWEHSLAPLNMWIVACPFAFVECLRALFRRDLKTYLDDQSNAEKISKRFNKLFAKPAYHFKECCQILFHKAVLLPELAIVLLENIIPSKSIERMLFYLCKCWSLGYLINYQNYASSKWSEMETEITDELVENVTTSDKIRLKSSDLHKYNGIKLSPILFPWFLNKTTHSDKANDDWSLNNSFKICISYKFPFGLPKIITEQLMVRASDVEKFQSEIVDHCIGSIQGEINDTNLIFRIYRDELEKENFIVKYEFRYLNLAYQKPQQEKECYSEIWKSMSKFLCDSDEFLDSYKGLWYERLIQCPHCKQDSFLGTWHISNNHIINEDKICQLCNELVPSYVLEPPKLKTNTSSQEVIKNLRRKFDRK